MLFSVRGRFADNFTFTINPVDASDAREALGFVHNSDEIKSHGSAIVMTTVKELGASKRKISISEKPAAERKGGRPKKVAAAEPVAAAAPATQARRR